MASGVAMVKNARRRLTCENASKRVHFVVPGVALLTPWKQNRENLYKIHDKMITKNTTPGVAMVKTARRRLTSENVSKRVHFCRSRCCFAHAIDRKNTQKK